jgi:RNA polymerase sigma-70 factor (ECF subfamily)
MADAGDITSLLRAAREGDDRALDRAVTGMYHELRRIAGIFMARERRDHTLQPTALLNEACLRLLGTDANSWEDRQHFLACAAQQMRRVLLDHARARSAQKRGGDGQLTICLPEPGQSALSCVDMLALDEALNELEAIDPRQCRIVELRYFAGFSEEEIAQQLNIAVRTVRRDWVHAKATLIRRLSPGSAAHVSAS